MPSFSPSRLTLARQRRGWTMVELFERSGLSTRSLSEYEAGRGSPTAENVERLSFALGFPASFFLSEEAVPLFPSPRRGEDPYTASPASFRSHYRIPSRDRERVLAAGLIAVMFAEQINQRFTMPPPAIPEFDLDQNLSLKPETVAEAVRSLWGLGAGPINNMVHLLEAKGVRVFRLVEELKEVDAFAFWRSNTPYVILNTTKSGERSRFDAAHELGHLVMHRHRDVCGRDAEEEANRFAAAFLLPKESFRKSCPTAPVLDYLLGLKPGWKVSVAAMVKRGQDMGIFSEWQARQAWIEISRRGWRTKEPNPLPHEYSQAYAKIQALLTRRGKTFRDIADELHLPWAEVEAVLPLDLSAPLVTPSIPTESAPAPVAQEVLGHREHLRLIRGGSR